MNNLNLDDVNNYVGQKIGKYYDQLIVAIKQVKFQVIYSLSILTF